MFLVQLPVLLHIALHEDAIAELRLMADNVFRQRLAVGRTTGPAIDAGQVAHQLAYLFHLFQDFFDISFVSQLRVGLKRTNGDVLFQIGQRLQPVGIDQRGFVAFHRTLHHPLGCQETVGDCQHATGTTPVAGTQFEEVHIADFGGRLHPFQEFDDIVYLVYRQAAAGEMFGFASRLAPTHLLLGQGGRKDAFGRVVLRTVFQDMIYLII